MVDDSSQRSEQVVADYKKHKLAISAIHQIQQTIRGFERSRKTDRRIAIAGILLLLLGLLGAGYVFLAMEKITLS